MRSDEPFCAADDDCGIRDVLDRLGDRWSVLVIVQLAGGRVRFRDLQRAIPGISQRMLTVTTKRLLRDGVVERTVYATIPPQVDYRLTAMGESLAQAIAALADWSREHKAAIAAARAAFDVSPVEGDRAGAVPARRDRLDDQFPDRARVVVQQLH